MSIRTVIVDDEPWARSRVSSLLNSDGGFEIVAQCANGEEAIAAISTHAPALVFLDIQLPDTDGFTVIESISRETMPVVIFATAFDQYALRAFDAHALDYLLKPFDEDRFRIALERAREKLRDPAVQNAAIRRMLQLLPEGRRYLDRVAVSAGGGRIHIVKTHEIDWLQASGNYVTLHVGRSTYVLRDTLNDMERKLDPRQFIRVHRSSMVNVDRVRALGPWSGGEQCLVLQDGTELTIGRMFRDRIRAFLDNSVTT
jgi:two-component system LytT family response regulator